MDVYHALAGADFNRVAGELRFQPGSSVQTIDIELDPARVSTNPYPKMFQVALDGVSGGGDLGADTAVVTIVREGEDRGLWQVWPRTQGPLDNNTIDR